MLKTALSLVVGLSLAALWSGWRQHSVLETAVMEGCLQAGEETEQTCACVGKDLSGEVSFVSLAGLGPLRPLSPSRDELLLAVDTALLSCQAA